jgi:prepilin-type N-terminal cleavage/methylation domain-containing protein
MNLRRFHQARGMRPARGFTLLELIIATTILLILSTMAVPMARLHYQAGEGAPSASRFMGDA